jgi:hypothetical protein
MPLRLSTGLRDKLIGAKANLVSNGTFNINTAGWTANNAILTAAAGGSNASTGLEIANSGAAAGSASVDVTTRAGRIYVARFAFRKGTAVGGSIDIGISGSPKEIFDGATLTDAALTSKAVAFVAQGATTRITLNNDSSVSGETAFFDDVVVEELLDGFNEIMRGSKINVYTGAQPTTANDAATGTLLFTITKGGDGVTGLEWTAASGGATAKPAGDTWAGTAINSGTAGWFRCYEEGDEPSAANTTNARFDGAVATAGAQINMTSTTIAAGAVQTVSSFTYTQPAA